MHQDEEKYGRPNPGAAPELSRFGFLIGTWRCDGRLKWNDGTSEALEATWVGRYVLDGYAIMDEFRMTRPIGELLVLGVNLRAYDVKKRAWAMKWLNALNGTWLDLGPEELGGVETTKAHEATRSMEGQSISYCFWEPVGDHALTRATYLDISSDHFTWRGERSDDGKVWDEFLVIEAYRSE